MLTAPTTQSTPEWFQNSCVRDVSVASFRVGTKQRPGKSRSRASEVVLHIEGNAVDQS